VWGGGVVGMAEWGWGYNGVLEHRKLPKLPWNTRIKD
jgi:hypothetical protein